MEKKVSIYTLPVEILVMVLKQCNVKEIVNLSSTCKHFNELINNSHGLWREKFKMTLVYDFTLTQVKLKSLKEGSIDAQKIKVFKCL